LRARLKGALVTRLARPGVSVINTHPVANTDGDWSAGNRFFGVHRAQLAALARAVGSAGGPPTFHAEYLPAGATAHCIDFILTAGEVEAESAEVIFTGKHLLRGRAGYVSDHLGLRAVLRLPDV
jgi:sphingomyelin phosphodiesterase 2